MLTWRFCSSIIILSTLPAELLGCIFSHLAPSWLRPVRHTCRSFRDASLPLIGGSLSATFPRDGALHQLETLCWITNLTLEIQDLSSFSLVVYFLRSARLQHLRLITRLGICHAEDLTALPWSPHLDSLAAGLKEATCLTRLTLVECRVSLIVVVAAACPQLEVLELCGVTVESWRSWEEECVRASFATLRQARKLNTICFDLPCPAPWAALLGDVTHLPLRSLGRVQVDNAAALAGLARLTQLTQLVVTWEHMADQPLAELSRLARLENLELDYDTRRSSDIPGLLRGLTNVKRLFINGAVDVYTLQAIAGLSRLTALELGHPISSADAGSLVQPWTSCLRRLKLALKEENSADLLDSSRNKSLRALGSALTKL